MRLRDGSTPDDPRLGRLPSFDERSRRFPARALLAADAQLRQRSWRCDPRLDQRQTPSCVGHAWTHDDAAEPKRRTVSSDLAMRWYAVAQNNDEWAGSDYQGSSTLGGAKAGVALGKFTEYRWCFGLDDLLLTVSNLGPVVVGTDWWTGMFHPDHTGLVVVNGSKAGGHEWLVRGINPSARMLIARNSWSRSWGYMGDFRITFDDMHRLLDDSGDACHPVR